MKLWMIVASGLTLPSALGTELYWPYLLLVPCIPAIIHMSEYTHTHKYSIIGAVVVYPKSPKFLYISKENRKATVASIQFYHGVNANIDKVIEAYDNERKLSVRVIWLLNYPK